MSPSLLLTGATSTLGRLLVQELDRRKVPIRALVDAPEQADALSTSLRIEMIWSPPDPSSVLETALDGIHRVFLLTPPAPDQIARQGAVIEAVERTGRPIHVVAVSAVGALPTNVPLQLARWHAVTEAQLRSTDLPNTILRPQFLMQNLLRAAPTIRADDMLCGAYGSARLPLVDGRDVAAAAATVLTTDGHTGGDYRLTGPQALTFPEVAEIVSAVLGRPIRYVDMTAEAYHEYLVGGGLAQWLADDLTVLARAFQSGHSGPPTSDVATITGRPAQPLDRFVHDHAEAFAPSRERSSSETAPFLACVTAFWSEADAPRPRSDAGADTPSRSPS